MPESPLARLQKGMRNMAGYMFVSSGRGEFARCSAKGF
jgi:hypothetical protein